MATSSALAIKKAVDMASWLLGAVGVVTTISGLISHSTIVALNTAGVIGVGSLVFGGGAFLSGPKSTPDERATTARNALLTMVVASVVCGAVFLSGRGLDEKESQANVLTVIGAANILFCAFLAVSARSLLESDTKGCPDCANRVLSAARKCQYCGYRFDGAG